MSILLEGDKTPEEVHEIKKENNRIRMGLDKKEYNRLLEDAKQFFNLRKKPILRDLKNQARAQQQYDDSQIKPKRSERRKEQHE